MKTKRGLAPLLVFHRRIEEAGFEPLGSTSRRIASAQDVAAQLQRSGAKRRTSGVRREQSHPLRHDFLGGFNDLSCDLPPRAPAGGKLVANSGTSGDAH